MLSEIDQFLVIVVGVMSSAEYGKVMWLDRTNSSLYNLLLLFYGKSKPITGLDRPLSFQEVEAPRSLDSRHMKVVRLSALLTGQAPAQEIFLVLISVGG
jgi:hypothetical protein